MQHGNVTGNQDPARAKGQIAPRAGPRMERGAGPRNLVSPLVPETPDDEPRRELAPNREWVKSPRVKY